MVKYVKILQNKFDVISTGRTNEIANSVRGTMNYKINAEYLQGN